MLLSILDFENSKEYAGFAKYSVETTIKEGNVVLGGVVGGYNLALEEAGADLERKLHSKDGLFLPTPRVSQSMMRLWVQERYGILEKRAPQSSPCFTVIIDPAMPQVGKVTTSSISWSNST